MYYYVDVIKNQKSKFFPLGLNVFILEKKSISATQEFFIVDKVIRGSKLVVDQHVEIPVYRVIESEREVLEKIFNLEDI